MNLNFRELISWNASEMPKVFLIFEESKTTLNLSWCELGKNQWMSEQLSNLVMYKV